MKQHSLAQLVLQADLLQVETVGFLLLLEGAGGHDGHAAALSTQGVAALAEENGKAVLLGHAVQEAPESFVTLLPVAGVSAADPLGAGQHVLRAQVSTLLIQTAGLCSLQTRVIPFRHNTGA